MWAGSAIAALALHGVAWGWVQAQVSAQGSPDPAVIELVTLPPESAGIAAAPEVLTDSTALPDLAATDDPPGIATAFSPPEVPTLAEPVPSQPASQNPVPLRPLTFPANLPPRRVSPRRRAIAPLRPIPAVP
jgi:hypothetical protein